MNEIPKRPAQMVSLPSSAPAAELIRHEHAVAVALWKALITESQCTCDRREKSICPVCQTIERVKASGWTP